MPSCKRAHGKQTNLYLQNEKKVVLSSWNLPGLGELLTGALARISAYLRSVQEEWGGARAYQEALWRQIDSKGA